MLSALNEKLVEPEDIRRPRSSYENKNTSGMFDGGTEYDKIPTALLPAMSIRLFL